MLFHYLFTSSISPFPLPLIPPLALFPLIGLALFPRNPLALKPNPLLPLNPPLLPLNPPLLPLNPPLGLLLMGCSLNNLYNFCLSVLPIFSDSHQSCL